MRLKYFTFVLFIFAISCVSNRNSWKGFSFISEDLQKYLSDHSETWFIVPGLNAFSSVGASVIGISSRNPGEIICLIFNTSSSSEELLDNKFETIFGSNLNGRPDDSFFNFRSVFSDHYFHYYIRDNYVIIAESKNEIFEGYWPMILDALFLEKGSHLDFLEEKGQRVSHQR